MSDREVSATAFRCFRCKRMKPAGSVLVWHVLCPPPHVYAHGWCERCARPSLLRRLVAFLAAALAERRDG